MKQHVFIVFVVLAAIMGTTGNASAQTEPRELKLTALHRAAFRNDTEKLATLLKVKDVDINVTAAHGETPLHIAAYEGHEESVKLLLARGANPNLEDNFHRTPLDLARSRNHTAIVGLLIPVTGTDAVAKKEPTKTGSPKGKN